jgi:4-aminobutyrate aminotransferase-like enzyme
MTKPGKKEPYHDLAHDVIERCFHKGLLFFSPVGAWGQTVKIAPPLTITEGAVREGLAVLGEAVDEAVAAVKLPAKGAHREPAVNGVLG